MTTLIVTLALLAFVPLWLLTTGLIALLGGWRSLADRYAEPDSFDVEPEARFRFRWTDVEVRDADPVIRIYAGAGAAVAAEWRRQAKPV